MLYDIKQDLVIDKDRATFMVIFQLWFDTLTKHAADMLTEELRNFITRVPIAAPEQTTSSASSSTPYAFSSNALFETQGLSSKRFVPRPLPLLPSQAMDFLQECANFVGKPPSSSSGKLQDDAENTAFNCLLKPLSPAFNGSSMPEPENMSTVLWGALLESIKMGPGGLREQIESMLTIGQTLDANIYSNTATDLIDRALQVNNEDFIEFAIYQCLNEIPASLYLVRYVVAALCGKINELSQGGANIGDQEAIVLAVVLATNKSLTSLDLSENNIGDEGAKAIAAALATNKNLAQLYLWLNNIEDEGAVAIAAALATNKNLTRLGLGQNRISPRGAKAIAAALATNTTLAGLDLSANNIGDAGAIAIAAALTTNKTLTELDLRYNNIGDAGAIAIAAALATNKTLTGLCLCYNNIGNEGAKALEEMLETNHTLTALWYNTDGIDETIVANIRNALKRNADNQKPREIMSCSSLPSEAPALSVELSSSKSPSFFQDSATTHASDLPSTAPEETQNRADKRNSQPEADDDYNAIRLYHR